MRYDGHMLIDFHAEGNRSHYATRDAAPEWGAMIRTLLRPDGLHVADIGCGGGIYTREWARLGAASVVGVDFSAPMLSAARERNHGAAEVAFVQGEAEATGLPGGERDVVFSRALIHHLDDLDACFHEARRLLRPGGRVIVQNRTPDDVALPGSPELLRGYFFACFPRLLEIETARRPASEQVVAALARAGFAEIDSHAFRETRRVYPGFDALAADLAGRTGRSILHALSDAELADLITFLRMRLPTEGALTERDRWTVWSGRVPPEPAAV